ncbi:TetR/AcrR family transcriptional regulator [Kitasatospora sp. NPDC048239]|uniref:TetR/AcrR family transcriptional regulator n=1 Tax=Kitasatospora sp. NPDC048239 TaxID=3364046 RepID=UPI00370FCDA1
MTPPQPARPARPAAAPQPADPAQPPARARDGARPMRADARRNYERLLAAAATVLEEQGTEASLEEVARRAGVGIGTLYRHFPTRAALLEAVLQESMTTLETRARELAAAPDAAAGVLLWLRDLAAYASRYRGLASAVMVNLVDEHTEFESCAGMLHAADALLRRAQLTGAVRADISMPDAVTLVNALVWSLEQGNGDQAQFERLFAVVADGLRPPAGA